MGVPRAGKYAADQLVRHFEGAVGQPLFEVEQKGNQCGMAARGRVALNHISRRRSAFPDILPEAVRMDAACHIRGNANDPHLPQAVENLPDMIGFSRDRYRLEQSELARAASASVVKEPVEGVDLFDAEVGGQGAGRLLAGTRPSRHTGALDGGDGW
nr:hypothetical protein [Sphingomonas sp. CDS-1]